MIFVLLLFNSNSYLFLDPLPDDASHLITVELDDRLSNLDLGEGSEMSSSNLRQHILFAISKNLI